MTFNQNITTSFNEQIEAIDFTDVTLVGEGKQHTQAHRVILSASSHSFREMLKEHPHSYIYLGFRTLCATMRLLPMVYHHVFL